MKFVAQPNHLWRLLSSQSAAACIIRKCTLFSIAIVLSPHAQYTHPSILNEANNEYQEYFLILTKFLSGKGFGAQELSKRRTVTCHTLLHKYESARKRISLADT